MIRKIRPHIAKIIIFGILLFVVIWSCSVTYIGVRHSNDVRVDADQTRELDSVTLFGEDIDIGIGSGNKRQKDTLK